MADVGIYLFYHAINIAINIAIAVAANYAIAALQGNKKPPQPEQAKRPIKQAIPPRQVGFGRCRMSGSYLLYTTVSKFTIDVIAVLQGPIDGWEYFFLNDDPVYPDGGGYVPAGADGRYGFNAVRILSRVGDFPETAYPEVATLAPGQWSMDHRADGVATIAMLCQVVQAKDQNIVYPNYEPVLSGVGRYSKVWDWRDPAQLQDDPSTWLWTRNAAVCFVHDEWYNRGQDWDYRFAPTIDYLTIAADICDEAIPLKAGGFEPRYTVDCWYELSNPPKDLRQKWLEVMDGFLLERGDGAFVLKAGKYEDPITVLDEDRILECSWARSRRNEDVVNRLVISYNSPEHHYTMVEADSWVDEADFALRGRDMPSPMELPWVTVNGQSRRLAKRRMSKLKAVYRGSALVTLSDDELELEQRFFRLKNRRGPPSMYDVVVEVASMSLDLANRTVRIDFFTADPNIDEWDPETEEGNPPDAPTAQPVLEIPIPNLLDVDAFLDNSGGGVLAPRLNYVIEDIDRDDLVYVVSWRVDGDENWTDEGRRAATSNADSPPTISVDSAFVPSVPALEARVKAISAAGEGDWSNVVTVNTSTAVGTPTEVTADVAPVPPLTARVTWRNPVTPFAYVRVYRNTVNNFGTSTSFAGDVVGGLGAIMSVDDTLAIGTYWFWVRAFDGAGNPGAPGGPDSVTLV